MSAVFLAWDVVKAFGGALVSNASLLSWCATNYTNNPTIHEGRNPREHTSKSLYPAMVIEPVGDDYGDESAGGFSHQVRLTMMLENKNTTAVGGEARRIRFDGAEDIDALEALVVDALRTWCAGTNISLAGIEARILDEDWPLWGRELIITVTMANVMGTGIGIT